MSLSVYDKPNGSYTSSIPPGTAAFRAVIAELYGFTRTEVIRDPGRCAGQRSEHCECGAVDFFTTDTVKGRKVFEDVGAVADRLGVQSIIFNRRVRGFGNPNERHYDGDSPHTDHVHIGLNRWARRNLTREMVRAALLGEEDWLDMATQAEVQAAFKAALTETVVPELRRLIIGLFSKDGNETQAAVGRRDSHTNLFVDIRHNTKPPEVS